MEIPKQLKSNRERLGLSQEDVANKIFVSRQTISNWETGKTYPDIQSLLLLSNLFGVSIDELVKGDVETMQSTINSESRRLKHLSWAMVGFMLVALVSIVFAIILRDVGGDARFGSFGMSYLSFASLLVCAVSAISSVVFAFLAERIKRQNDLVTYREIVAFEKGMSVEDVRKQDALGRKHPIVYGAIMVLVGAVGAVTILLILEILAKTIRDIIF